KLAIVQGQKIEIGGAERENIQTQTHNGEEKYLDNGIDAQDTKSRKNHNFHTECNLHLRSGSDAAASGNHTDAQASSNAALPRHQKQLRRYKRRLKSHHGKERYQAKMAFAAQNYVLAPAPDEERPEVDGQDDWQPMIIAESSADIPDCSVGEAVMRMDLANLPAMMFQNSKTKELNVVYRRADGNIGWIDPRIEKSGETA